MLGKVALISFSHASIWGSLAHCLSSPEFIIYAFSASGGVKLGDAFFMLQVGCPLPFREESRR